MNFENKNIILAVAEKATLTAALSNVIENIDVLDKINPNPINNSYEVNLFGGQYDACIFALQETDTEIAHNLVEKIRKAPNVSTKYD
ncbi:MAG: hypothetical protein J5992_03705 [Oscillospiraceae bacterium]|nr:hypothetical protein [Oscillospiraceae bacterium]